MRLIYKKQTVRLTAEEYTQLKALSEKTGMSMESVIRQLIMGVRLRPRPTDEYAAILRELSAIGNNINQIACWANATKGISGSGIDHAVALVNRAWQLVKESM